MHIKIAMQTCGVASIEEHPSYRVGMKDGSVEHIGFRPVYGLKGSSHRIERNGMVTGYLASGNVPNQTTAVLELHKLLKKEKA